MHLGTKIKQLRERKYMSQTELAHLLNIEQSSLSRIESDKTEKLDFKLMDKICEIFKVDLTYFMEGKNIQTNNDNTSNNTNALYNYGTINNFPKELQQLLHKIIETHEKQNKFIESLKGRV